MIPLRKLSSLEPGQRRRKLALCIGAMEASLASGEPVDQDYLRGLLELAAADPKLHPVAAAELADFLGSPALDARRAANCARHAVLAASGFFPGEWDLVQPGDSLPYHEASRRAEPSSRRPIGAASGSGVPRRPFRAGLRVFVEDVRSPFNVGSIFRTAEAFAAERVYVSPLCAPPDHPRAIRSAMGAVDLLPWERRTLAELPNDVPLFALETGGVPIDEFEFPECGIVVVGSEELGVSPEALARAGPRRVTIPMGGMKASLNVGVAFGILLRAWVAYLDLSASKPF